MINKKKLKYIIKIIKKKNIIFKLNQLNQVKLMKLHLNMIKIII